MRPDGTHKTVSYSANPQVGFRAVPFGQLGVALPPFPDELNTNKDQKEEEDDFIVVNSLDRGDEVPKPALLSDSSVRIRICVAYC